MRVMNERTAAASLRPGRDLLDEVAQLGELGAQARRGRRSGAGRRPARRAVVRDRVAGGPAGRVSRPTRAPAQARRRGSGRRRAARRLGRDRAGGGPARASARLRDQLAHGGRHLLGEAPQVVGGGDREDVGAHAGRQRQLGELLGARELPLMLSRRRIASGGRPASSAAASIARVHAPAARRGRRSPCSAASRRPCAPVSAQHPRLVGAEPDLDVVRRRRPGLRAVEPVVRAVVRGPGRPRPRSPG